MGKVWRTGISEQPGEGFRQGNFLWDFAPGHAEVWGAKKTATTAGRWEGIGKFYLKDESVVIIGPDGKPAGRETMSFSDEFAFISAYTIPKQFSKLRNAKTPLHIPEFLIDLRIGGTDSVSGLPYVAVTHLWKLDMTSFPLGTVHGELELEVTLG